MKWKMKSSFDGIFTQ